MLNPTDINALIHADHTHVWHPFTPMKQWRQSHPLIIHHAQGDLLYDVHNNPYIDGVSSIWCNVHGHRVPEIDNAIRDQLDKVAHTTMLGLVNVPATQLAELLVNITPPGLNKVFYSDAGATATEVAFKMAAGYWFNNNQPQRDTFIGIAGAYHGDTTGAMSIGYSERFHRAYKHMVFKTQFAPAPDLSSQPNLRTQTLNDEKRIWSTEDQPALQTIRDTALNALDRQLTDLVDRAAAIVIEPLVQGAAGLITQPPGYLAAVAQLAKKHNTLLIADEVAVGFGRTGKLFACQHENVSPDILCLGKGLTGGYLPLAATLCTDEIEQAFTGEIHEHKTLYHGHTFTGNPLAAAAAIASINLFKQNNLIEEVIRKASLAAQLLNPLRDPEQFPHVTDVRQIGLMIGIQLQEPIAKTSDPDQSPTVESNIPGVGAVGGFDPARRIGYEVADLARKQGVIIRPIGPVVILMPPLAISDQNLQKLITVTIDAIHQLRPR